MYNQDIDSLNLALGGHPRHREPAIVYAVVLELFINQQIGLIHAGMTQTQIASKLKLTQSKARSALKWLTAKKIVARHNNVYSLSDYAFCALGNFEQEELVAVADA